MALGLVAASFAFASATPAWAALPDGRKYELVTPAEKFGYDVADRNEGGATSTAIATRAGDAVAFQSMGAFADATFALVGTYIARRGPAGWESTNITPRPVGDITEWGVSATPNPRLYDQDMRSTVFTSVDGGPPSLMADDETGVSQVFLRDPLGALTWVSRPEVAPPSNFAVTPVAATDDLSTIVFSTRANITAAAAGHTTNSELYVWRNGVLDTVGKDHNGTTIVRGAALGGSALASNGQAYPVGTHALSDDGSRLFFQGGDPHVGGSPTGTASWGTASNLYMRSGGATTLISRSAITNLPSTTSAKFLAASSDGSVVYFTTTAQLTSTAPTGGSIYKVTPGNGAITFIAADTGGTARPLGISDDGSRLYVMSGGQIQRIYNDAMSPVVAAVPNFTNAGALARVSDDGKTLAFVASNLVGFGGEDTESLYVYTEDDGLRCSSCSVDGGGAPEHVWWDAASSFLGATYPLLPALMSRDGSRIYFDTESPLVPEDTNGKRDVYQDADGVISLVSGGKGAYHSYFVDASDTGDDVFFATRDSLTAWDTDGGALDIYDARVGGGFADPPAPPTECEGDACQGTPTPAPPTTTPPSSVFDGPGNRPDPLTDDTPRIAVSPISKSMAKRLASKGTGTLTVTISEPGQLELRGRAKIGTARRNVAAAQVDAKRKGKVALPVRLDRRARAELKKRKKLAVSFLVSYSEVTGDTRATVTLHR